MRFTLLVVMGNRSVGQAWLPPMERCSWKDSPSPDHLEVCKEMLAEFSSQTHVLGTASPAGPTSQPHACECVWVESRGTISRG